MAPARIVPPLSATDQPSLSMLPAAAASLVTWFQLVPERLNTKTAPSLASADGDPTAITSPSKAAAYPNAVNPVKPAAVNLACWVHLVPDCTYTYAAPLPP